MQNYPGCCAIFQSSRELIEPSRWTPPLGNVFGARGYVAVSAPHHGHTADVFSVNWALALALSTELRPHRGRCVTAAVIFEKISCKRRPNLVREVFFSLETLPSGWPAQGAPEAVTLLHRQRSGDNSRNGSDRLRGIPTIPTGQ